MLFKQIPYKTDEWRLAVRLREKVLREPLGSFIHLKIRKCALIPMVSKPGYIITP